MRSVVEELVGSDRALRALQAPEQVVYDPLKNRWGPTSSIFRAGRDGTVSVDLEQILKLDGRDLTYNYGKLSRSVGMVAHTVERLVHAGFVVMHVPLEENDYHGEARGKLPKSKLEDLRGTCEIIVPVDGVAAQRYEDERLARQALAHKEATSSV